MGGSKYIWGFKQLTSTHAGGFKGKIFCLRFSEVVLSRIENRNLFLNIHKYQNEESTKIYNHIDLQNHERLPSK